MKSNVNVKITRELKAPDVAGVHYRLLCMTGKNKGISYYLKGKRAIIGRSETADVQISDIKSSREHAEVTFLNNTYVVTDLGSQNGVTVNDLKINQHRLEDGDKIIIGSTVLKYNIIKVENTLTLVEDEADEVEEVESSPKKKNKKKKKQDSPEDKRKKLIYGVVGVLVVLMLLPQGEEKEPQIEPGAPILGRDSGAVFETGAGRPRGEEDREQEVKLNTVLHRGLREFREGNYFRAMEEFNFALLMSPNHGRATFYLNRTKQRLDEEIELNFFKARQEADALKLDSAIVSYCQILRLLRDYSDDERYIEASNEIDTIRKRMGYDINDNLCNTGK
jgi:hypothetical protein